VERNQYISNSLIQQTRTQYFSVSWNNWLQSLKTKFILFFG